MSVNAIIGRKVGMTRVFTEDGKSLPVTVIEALPNRVTEVKTKEKHGYDALQVTIGSIAATKLNRAQAALFEKSKVEAGRGLWELRLGDATEDVEVGSEINVSRFTSGTRVDVSATSKGKGFQGTVKRWNFKTQDATHGNSLAHRKPGSIGQCQDPGKVWKGKKMAGQMGNEKVTVQSLEVVSIDNELNIMLIKGAVPGAKDGEVLVKYAAKVPLSKQPELKNITEPAEEESQGEQKSAEPAAQQAAKPEPEQKASAEPSAQQAAKLEPEQKASAEPAAEQAAKPEPEQKASAEPAAQQAAKPEPEQKASAEPAAQQVAKPEPEQKASAEPAAQQAAKPEPEQKASAEPSAEQVAKPEPEQKENAEKNS